MNRRYLAILPVAIILTLTLIFYVSGLHHELSFQTIKHEHLKWKMFVFDHPLLAALYFIGIYVASVVLVIPDSTLLTLIAGFLFPLPLAMTYSCIAETVGATLFFLATRFAYSETLGKRKGYLLHQMQVKFLANQAYYLLFLRFSHLLPFWLTNLGAGIFHARVSTFMWTTLIGVIPLTFFIANSGSSLSSYFETHTHFSLQGVFTSEVKICLIVLGCLALMPIAFKRFLEHRRKRRKH